jgi:DNA-binding IclR family transcriptional regulator
MSAAFPAPQPSPRHGPSNLEFKAATPTPISDSPQLLQRTFHVLSLFTPERQEWTVTEIGRECDLAVPTVHRILTALHRNGYLVRDDNTKRFRFGSAILRMGRTASLAVDMCSLAEPLLQALSRRTTQTALLTVISDDRRNAVCLERVESSEPLRLSVQPGRRLPLHAGASQKILLAYLPSGEFAEYIDEPLAAICASTIDEPGVLANEVATIRQRGWASSFEETNLGVWGLSVAVLDETGRATASIGVAGPSERKPRNLNPWLRVLAQAATQLAEPLGLTSSLRVVERRIDPCPPGPTRPSLTSKETIS